MLHTLCAVGHSTQFQQSKEAKKYLYKVGVQEQQKSEFLVGQPPPFLTSSSRPEPIEVISILHYYN